jgi:hypothetical protein
MKHPSIRELFEYWNTRRGRRAAPERGDIEPGAIRGVLADTFILTFDERNGHPFRIAGTRVCALFARDLKGRSFLDLWSRASRSAMRDMLAIVAHESIGVVAGVSGATGNDGRHDFEMLMLPLSNLGRTDSRLLGALAPTEVPKWLGAQPLHGLTLGPLRYLGSAVSAPAIAEPPQGRRRHGLVVYDGGLS